MLAPARDALPVQAHEAPVSILDSTAFQSAWVDGRDVRGIPLCCGRAVMRFGVSWCEPHARRVIRPAAWVAFIEVRPFRRSCG